jgi:hypothetical protein
MESFEVCYTAGIQIEKRLNELLQEDNKELLEKWPSYKEN